jgi:hypothetical protein
LGEINRKISPGKHVAAANFVFMHSACAEGLQESGERCGLLGLRSGSSLLLLLLGERVAASPELLASLADAALPTLRGISQGAAAELSAANHWHIPGMRCGVRRTLDHNPSGIFDCALGLAFMLGKYTTDSTLWLLNHVAKQLLMMH